MQIATADARQASGMLGGVVINPPTGAVRLSDDGTGLRVKKGQREGWTKLL